MANQFIEVIEDKFSDTMNTVVRMKYSCHLTSLNLETGVQSIWGRLSLVKDNNAELIYLELDTQQKSWIFLRDGKMVIRINDNENITLTPRDIYTNVEEDGRCHECCSYLLNKEVLTKICKADKVEYEISSKYITFTNEDNKENNEYGDFGKYCRRFYNGVYDENAYVESLEVTKSSGCMVAAVVFGASLAALSSGAYYLISSLLG